MKFVLAAMVAASVLMAADRALAIERSIVFRPGEQVLIQSDNISYYRSSDLYVAQGGVNIRYGSNMLTADKVVLDRSRRIFTATGAVRLTDGESVMLSDRVVAHLDDRTGVIFGGQVYLRDSGYRFAGEKIEKIGEDEFIVRRGSFTTCNCAPGEAPSWEISARSIWVTVGGYARVQNALFYVKGVPVLYLPYGYFPVKTEREFGLLFPTLTYSRDKGFEIHQGLFIPIGASADATVWADYYSDLGYGASAEFRYVAARGSYGNTNLKFIRQTKVAGVETDLRRDRYTIDSTHRYNFGEYEAAVADVHVVSDRQYYAELGPTLEQKAKQFTRSEASYLKSWQSISILPQAELYERLGRERGSSLNRLPHVGVLAFPRTFGDQGPMLTVRAIADNFVAKPPGIGILETDRYRTLGQRADMSASLENPIYVGPLEAVPFATARETAYRSTIDEPGGHRESFSLGTRLGSPFERRYEFGDRATGPALYHRIEPVSRYLFMPEIGQDELPVFDEFDRLAAKNLVEYGIENGLFLTTPGASGLLRFGLFRHYDLAASTAVGANSPVLGRLQLKLPGGSRFGVTEYYDPHAPRSKYYHGVYRAETPVLGGLLSVEYHRIANYLIDQRTRVLVDPELDAVYRRYDPPTPWASRELWGTVSRQFFDHLTVLYGARYSFDRRLLLESVYGFDFLSFCDCWSVAGRFVQRPNNDLLLNLTFTLVGIGSLGN